MEQVTDRTLMLQQLLSTFERFVVAFSQLPTELTSILALDQVGNCSVCIAEKH